MPEPEITRKGERIDIGTTVRVEAGPALRRRRATKEVLSNAITADHYQLGRRDAKGEEIKEGAMFAYLDWLAPPVFYLFKKRDLDPDDPQYAPGEIDPTLPPLDEGSTNIRRFTYIFDEVGVYGTEDEAVEAGLALAGEA